VNSIKFSFGIPSKIRGTCFILKEGDEKQSSGIFKKKKKKPILGFMLSILVKMGFKRKKLPQFFRL
jgi:hypothetical protein